MNTGQNKDDVQTKKNASTKNPDRKEVDEIKKKLFNSAMKGNWTEVVEIYTINRWIHKAKITRFGGTALHIAVSEAKEDVVEKLLGLMSEIAEVLRIGDERGNTPLHTAASLGNVKMCLCIAREDTSLIGVGNRDSETPFFLAALHGHTDAFLCLHSLLCKDEQPTGKGYDYSRRNDGETILHCAIAGDYFDLAFQIIHLYENLVNSVNERGLSPLHLLAAKPSAFRSGSHLGRFEGFIYHCIFVDKLKVVEPSDYQTSLQEKSTGERKTPPNYETFSYLITLLVKAIIVVTQTLSARECPGNEGNSDMENPGPRECPENKEKPDNAEKTTDRDTKAEDPQIFPPNFTGTVEFFKLVSRAMFIILGIGSNDIRKIRDKKQKHTWSLQIMNELLQRASMYEYDDDGRKPILQTSSQSDAESYEEITPYDSNKNSFVYDQLPPTNNNVWESGANQQQPNVPAKDQNQADNKEKMSEMKKWESPILIAAKYGIKEIVEKILEKFPVAIHDMNSEKKNVVLLAVENRQPHVYQFLLQITNMKENVFGKVDHEGNSALHLAAKLGKNKPWLIPGAALQMQWEIKWYEFVKDSVPFHFFVRYNKDNKSPKELFSESHKELVEDGGKWLSTTSKSCSVVAALIATVAFSTAATVPGGVRQDNGRPTLGKQPVFHLFAISSLIALCFSVTALFMFLAILTSRYQEQDFGRDLPRKLLVGLSSLFVSIASMMVSFCAGHFFVLKDQWKYDALAVYAMTCLPVTFFAIAQFPLYFDLIWAIFKQVPQRSYKVVPN